MSRRIPKNTVVGPDYFGPLQDYINQARPNEALVALSTKPRRATRRPTVKHAIRDYDQTLIRLTQLTKNYSAASREYKFAVGDLFNQVVPAGPNSPAFAGTAGMEPTKFQQYISREVDRLLEESGAGEFISHKALLAIQRTARAWKKAERTFDVSFTVYDRLTKHKTLIRDGMTTTEAQRAVANANSCVECASPAELSHAIRNDNQRAVGRRHVFNQTQWLKITANQLSGQLSSFSQGHKDSGDPFSDEDVEMVRQMYRTLDEFVTDNDIEHIWDLET